MTFKFDQKPDCRRCRRETVIADAGIFSSKPYYYCRSCKVEVDFWGWEVHPNVPSSMDSGDFSPPLPVRNEQPNLKELEAYLRSHPEMQGCTEDQIIKAMADENRYWHLTYTQIAEEEIKRAFQRVLYDLRSGK